MFNSVAIFGLGLLGGSICRALKQLDPGVRISAYGRSTARLEPALADRTVDAIGTFDRIDLAGVDLAVVCTPVDSTIDIITGILGSSSLDPRAIVIDVGSVKEAIVRAAVALERSAQFIGCHPMAGSEKAGYEHSRPDLYRGSSVIITPHQGNRQSDIDAAAGFWKSLGARTVVVSPEEHDRIVAYTSHLPHMAACALVEVFHAFRAEDGPQAGIGDFIGNGFRDATRISSGSPDMWRDIVLQNKDNISGAIDRLIEELGRLRKLITGDGPGGELVHDYLAAAKKIRDGLK